MPDDSSNINAGRPSLCRNCGSIVGAGEAKCAVCGANISGASDAPQQRQVADSETIRFARAILDRPYKFTVILLVANLFIFLLMWQSSGMSFSMLGAFPTEVLIAYGAKVNRLINAQNQWWRFVTPMFIHVNLLHLMVNMYSLWIVGPYVEKLYGSAKFVVFWVLSGIAGLVASYLTVVPADTRLGRLGGFIFKLEDAPSAGASGALFGLVGVLFVFGIKFRRELPEGFKRAFGTGLLPMIVLNLFIGYLGRGVIDNAAHLGGFICGAIFALAVDYRRPGEKTGIARMWQVLQWFAIAIVVISFIKVAQHYRDPIPPELLFHQSASAVDEQTQKFVLYAKAMNDAQDAFFLLIKDRDASTTDEAVKTLDAAPQLDPKADELKEKLKTLLITAKGLAVPAANSASPSNVDNRSFAKLGEDFEAWSKDYRAWLKTTGRNYGLIEATKPDSSPQ